MSVNFSLLGIPRPHIQQDESSWRVIQFPSLPAFGLHGFFPSLSAEPFYGSLEKCQHQRTTLLGYYELMWSKTGKDGGRKKTLVMDHKLHFLWNGGIRSGCYASAADRYPWTVLQMKSVNMWNIWAKKVVPTGQSLVPKLCGNDKLTCSALNKCHLRLIYLWTSFKCVHFCLERAKALFSVILFIYSGLYCPAGNIYLRNTPQTWFNLISQWN